MKILTGKVVSTKMDKTVVVSIQRSVFDKLYKKLYSRTKRIKAHNDFESVRVGDTVKITHCRPYSKQTHFKVVEKV